MTNKLFKKVTEWQLKTFGTLGASVFIDKLKEEVLELSNEIEPSDEKLSEYADCFIVLFGALNADCYTLLDLSKAIEKKHSINESSDFENVNGAFKRIKK